NEVFFDDVRIPAENLVGEENEGWGLAKVTLGNERVSLSGEGALWGRGPTANDLVVLVKKQGGCTDQVSRQRLAQVWMEGEILRLIRLRTVSAAIKGRPPGPEASVRKALADDHGQNIMRLAKDLSGAGGLLAGGGPYGPLGSNDPQWHYGFLYAEALTIGGGMSQGQPHIIGERVLGLPHDIDVQACQTWTAA